MTTTGAVGIAAAPASHVLGRKLDSIPFSAYHVVLIVVLGFVGFIEGYDLALSGSLLVLAKAPLHLTPDEIRWLAVGPTFVVVLGGFAAAAMSDRVSRLTVMQIGVILSTLCTLLILLAQNFEQLLILRLITGIGLGFTISAPFPIAAELMPAQHRRTYGAIYEVMLAAAFTLLPFVAFVLADHPSGFRLVGLPGGVTLFIAPVLVYFLIPESPRWLLRRGRPQTAVEAVNLKSESREQAIAHQSPAAIIQTRSAARNHYELGPDAHGGEAVTRATRVFRICRALRHDWFSKIRQVVVPWTTAQVRSRLAAGGASA